MSGWKSSTFRLHIVPSAELLEIGAALSDLNLDIRFMDQKSNLPREAHIRLRRALIASATDVSLNEGAPQLVEASLRAGTGQLSAAGALAVDTGSHTGRSPKDKYLVRDALTFDKVWWDNTSAMAPETFDVLLEDAAASLSGGLLFVQDLAAGADPAFRYAVSVYTPSAWHALFIRNLLIRNSPETALARPVSVVHAPAFAGDPTKYGTRSQTVIALDLTRNIVVIAGTAYAGEIKKSVFSLFNFHAPFDNVLPMHCSANVGAEGDVALFFGLSGTGKTTLSTDSRRPLVGDDEHGWSERGVFNLEGGCYAKTARLNPTAEPQITQAAQCFGTVLENVALHAETRVPDFDDLSRTENARAAYSLDVLPGVHASGMAGTPETVVFLTADAFGVLPPLARLTPEQAEFHFLSGYTAKVAGTERGVVEPQVTFSACFGAPFMPLHPLVYGTMLSTRLRESGARCFLLNTGWTGGGYGVGRRIDIAATRRLLDAALSGLLDEAPMRRDPIFGLSVPLQVPGIPDSLLDPRSTWANPAEYDRLAEKLAVMFAENWARFGYGAHPGGMAPWEESVAAE